MDVTILDQVSVDNSVEWKRLSTHRSTYTAPYYPIHRLPRYTTVLLRPDQLDQDSLRSEREVSASLSTHRTVYRTV